MKIGILGGTFNPLHKGHLYAADMARQALGFDQVWFIPNHLPPHKPLPLYTASPQQRYEMLCLGVANLPWARVCDLEIKEKTPSYTYKTLKQLKKNHPSYNFWLIIGTDSFLTIDKWVKPNEIFARASLAVVAREEESRTQLLVQKQRLDGKTEIALVSCGAVEISSTKLRQKPDLSFLPQAVYDYIQVNGLYFDSEEGENSL